MGLGHTKKPMSQAMAATSAPHSEATWGPVPYGFTWTPRRRNRNWVQWAALNFYLEMPHISKQESKKCIEVCLWWLWWYIYIYVILQYMIMIDYDDYGWLWYMMINDGIVCFLMDRFAWETRPKASEWQQFEMFLSKLLTPLFPPFFL